MQTPKPPLLPTSKDYFVNDISLKICHQVPLRPETPGVGRASPSEVGAGAARGGRAAGWPGSRGAVGSGGRGPAAAARRPAGSSREPAGRAEREPQPERGGEGRSQERPPPLPEEPRGRHTRPPPPPPRSLALTPGRRRRAARAPPAPHGRPPHGALRPRVAAQPGPAHHAEVRGRERGGINMQIPCD